MSESNGVAQALRQAASEASLDPELITDLQHAFGVGSAVWEHQYLTIGKSGPPKPTHPDGALHYVAGWLATDPYLEVLTRWGTHEPFFQNLYQLAKVLRGLEPFRYSLSGPIKMVSGRLIDGASYVKRGHLPFPELLFRTWKASRPVGIPQTVLWAAYLNHDAYTKTHNRSVFDAPILDLISQLRNAIAPEKNGGEKWLSLNNALHDMQPVRTPDEVRTHFLRKADEYFNDECWPEISRNIRKIGVIHNPAVYLGSKETLSESDRLLVIQRFGLGYDDPPEQPNPLPVSSSTGDAVGKKRGRLPNTKDSSSKDPQPKVEETDEENFLRSTSGKIGSINLEFAQRAVYAENPFLSYKQELDVYQFLSGIDLEEILENNHRLNQSIGSEASELKGLAILIWTAVQIGGHLDAAASMVIHYTPQKEFGLQPDLSGIWRTRSQQQKNTPEVSCDIFLPLATIEKRSFPDHLVADLDRLWKTHFTHLGQICKLSNKLLRQVMTEIGLHLGQTKIDWTSNLLRTSIAKTKDNETHALLLQSNAHTKFTSDAAYYSVIEDHPAGPLNIAGSPYCFRLDEFGGHLKRFLNQEYSADSLCAWNLWTDKILAILACATGIRPVVDMFAEVENFSKDFSLVLIDDKEVVTRDSRRIVQLPKTVSSLLAKKYLQSLRSLKNKLPTNHPIRSGIDDLLQHRSEARIPLFFHLTEKGIEHVHFGKVASSIHPGLPPNFARHLISNHLQIDDRELISIQLGHQIEGLYSFGPTSLRTLKNDLKALANAFQKFFDDQSIVVPNAPELAIEQLNVSAHLPTSFGKRKRNAAMMARWKSLSRDIQNSIKARIAEERRNGEIDKPLNLLQTVIKETTAGITSDFERTLLKRICTKQFRLLLPDMTELFDSPSRNRTPKPVFSSHFLTLLNERASTHPAFMKLLREARPRSKSDAFTLLALSLVKNNGITDPQLFQQLTNRRFETLILKDQIHIEIYPGKIARPNETCRRHQLSANSRRFIDTLSAFSDHPLRATNVKLSDDLTDRLSEIFGNTQSGKTAEDLVQHLQAIEYAHQRFTLPAALAEVARGATKHRSIDRASLLAINGEPRPTVTESEMPKPSSCEFTHRDTDITKSIRDLVRSIGVQPIDFDQLERGTWHKSIAHRALITFTRDLFQRRGLGRPYLADSTKRLYLGRIAEFFRRTDAQSAIQALDQEDLQETIDVYLDERSAYIDTVIDDARQIGAFCKALLANGFPGPLSVPYIDPDFNPSTMLLSRQELEQIDKIVYEGHSDQDISVYALYRYFGFRRREGLNQGVSRVFDSGSEMIIQIKGDSTFRTKTPGGNRNARSLWPLPTAAVNAFKVRLRQGRDLASPYLVSKSDHEIIVGNITRAIKSIVSRGHIHVLRHNYGDNLLRELLNYAIWGVRKPDSATPRCISVTTPQGIRRHTLQAAARLLGHSTPKMLLTTYSHCGFDVLDSIYRQSNHDEAAFDEAHQIKHNSTDDQNTTPLEVVTSNPKSKSIAVTKPRAIDFITRKFSELDSVIPINESLEILEFSKYLNSLPDTHRPSLGSNSDKKYLKPSRVFLRELQDSNILRSTCQESLSEVFSFSINSLEPFLRHESKYIREQLAIQVRSFLSRVHNNQPIGNFNKDKLFAVRENNFYLDFSLFLSIMKLSETTFSDYCFKSNSPTDQYINQILRDLGFGEIYLTKHDHRKSLEFNLEHGHYWLFTARPPESSMDTHEANPAKDTIVNNAKKKRRGRPKGSKNTEKSKIVRAFDNSKLYLYGITLQILMLANHETRDH
ncbi:MAG: hypothetical protein ACK4FF_02025 [Limnobacter sp.]|uniref:hypothetical protein n=1 Tax=Limnobacter sp. TaxID=2003368 RepID=UPI00391B2B3C